MTVSAGLRARRSRWALAGMALALGLVTTLIVSRGDTASADATLECHGTLARDKEEPGGLKYRVGCNQKVWAISVITNKPIVEFGTQADVYVGKELSAPEPAFECEGILPGNGLSCYSNGSPALGADVDHDLVGTFVPRRSACSHSKHNRFQAWFIATVDPGAEGAAGGYATNTEPIPMKTIRCRRAHH